MFTSIWIDKNIRPTGGNDVFFLLSVQVFWAAFQVAIFGKSWYNVERHACASASGSVCMARIWSSFFFLLNSNHLVNAVCCACARTLVKELVSSSVLFLDGSKTTCCWSGKWIASLTTVGNSLCIGNCNIRHDASDAPTYLPSWYCLTSSSNWFLSASEKVTSALSSPL